jgi:competence protein ComFC
MGLLYDSLGIPLSLLFPGNCLVCGKELCVPEARNYPVCEGCVCALTYVSGNRCRICSTRLISERDICTRCRATTYSFDSNYSLFEYTGIAKELIYQYKFEGRHSLAKLFADLLAKVIKESYAGIPLIPVPSSRKSKKKRGWDHMNVIMKSLGRGYGIRFFNVLGRITDIPQKELSYPERLENLKGKISFDKAKVAYAFKEAVLIDDVFTTGATTSECARVLKENDISRVNVITLAID